MNDYEYLLGLINKLKKKTCCCEGDLDITTLSPPVAAPSTNGPTILFNLTTGVLYYWDGDSWEIFGSGIATPPEYASMADATAALGLGAWFRYATINLDGATPGSVHITL